MPSGYTAPITERENFTFKEFATRCARAFGALIMLRDEPMDSPLPERFEPSDYHKKAMAEAETSPAIQGTTVFPFFHLLWAAYDSNGSAYGPNFFVGDFLFLCLLSLLPSLCGPF